MLRRGCRDVLWEICGYHFCITPSTTLHIYMSFYICVYLITLPVSLCIYDTFAYADISTICYKHPVTLFAMWHNYSLLWSKKAGQ